MNTAIPKSTFYMWRALFSIIHADRVIAPEEIAYAMDILDTLDALSDEQRNILCEDLRTPQDPGAMFAQITAEKDRATLFKFAGALVWVDGQYAREEKELMLLLEDNYLQGIDVDGLAGDMSALFDDAGAGGADAGDLKTVFTAFKTLLAG